MEHYSDEELLEYLRQLAKKLGRTPRGRDLDLQKKGLSNIFIVRFDGLINAAAAAGLRPVNTPSGEIENEKEYILNRIKKLAKKLGRTPSMRDIIAVEKVSYTYFCSYFGSYSNAVKAAGLVPNKRSKKHEYTKEYLLNYLKELSEKLGRTPYGSDIDKAGDLKYCDYYNCFGSLKKAREAAGIVYPEQNKYPERTNIEILKYLNELAVKLGHTPKANDIINDRKISISTIRKRFRRYNNALKQAGLAPNKDRCF